MIGATGFDEAADYVVVGSGAAGATVAKTLVDAGKDVAIVEEGPHFPLAERTTSIAKTAAKALRGGGFTAFMGQPVIPYLQGRCVGGTTVVNGAIVWRLPEDVHAEWIEHDPGLGGVHSYSRLERCFEAIERDLSVGPAEDAIWGELNWRLSGGSESLDWEYRRINRNAKGCKGSARCLHGCPIGAKQSMEQSYIPYAQQRGARLFSECTVLAVRSSHGRATGVVAKSSGTGNGGDSYLRIAAREGVVLAAGAIQTPMLLLHSGLRAGPVGKGLMCHPGLSVGGRFEGPVGAWDGVTQGLEVTHFRKQGIKLESFTFPPEYGAMRMAGAGTAFVERVAELDSHIFVGAAIRSGARGRVRSFGGAPLVTYSLSRKDVAMAKKGLEIGAQLMQASGAKAVLPGVSCLPGELDADGAAAAIALSRLGRSDLKMATTHLFGGAAMGTDPGRSVVSPRLESHVCRGLYIVDASVFPTNTGVNPQNSIMAIAMNATHEWLGA